MQSEVQPYYSEGGITIYHGDCRDVMPSLGSEAADHVVTDLPYGETTHAGARSCRPDLNRIDFASIDEGECVRAFQSFVSAARRWVISTCEWRFVHAIERAMPDAFVRMGVWVKPDCAPQFSGDRPGTGWESIAILHRPGVKRWNGGGRRAVWTHNIVKTGSLHPTQKPAGFMQALLCDFTDAGETVLDPYAGSGSTLVAAKLLGRNAIGIEREERYCEIAAKRLAQGVLFGTEVA